MTINVQLSQDSIRQAIRQLEQVKENINNGLTEAVDILLQEGEFTASAFIGSFDKVSVSHEMTDDTTGSIKVTGEAAVIQEFGAGDLAETGNPFENEPGVPLGSGTYSRLKGSGEYALTGQWHFGGKRYQYVDPKHGLYHAREWIKDHSTEVAERVIRL